MNRSAYISIAAVSITALISGYFLWLLVTDVSKVEGLGLSGIFLVTLLSHLTMVARDIFIPLFLSLTPLYHPLILGTAAGVGGAIGDVAPYVLGMGVAETVKSDGSKAEDLVSRWISKYGLWAILIVAATPLPDLPVVMLAGTRRLPFKKLLIIEAIGKTALYSVGAFFGGWMFDLLIGAVGSLTASALILLTSITFCILLTWPPSRDWLFKLLDRFITV